MREKSNFNRIALSSTVNAPIHTKALKINLKKYHRSIPVIVSSRTYLFVKQNTTQQERSAAELPLRPSLFVTFYYCVVLL
ncbi:hypothetical protein [Bacillus mycoides]|uniref:hypothetical protein n=1 Tax=Bacillus mycoides TaxID=1405 RepID=UPI0011EEB039|nr:hypothetical protein [Bacillus mycoides]